MFSERIFKINKSTVIYLLLTENNILRVCVFKINIYINLHILCDFAKYNGNQISLPLMFKIHEWYIYLRWIHFKLVMDLSTEFFVFVLVLESPLE